MDANLGESTASFTMALTIEVGVRDAWNDASDSNALAQVLLPDRLRKGEKEGLARRVCGRKRDRLVGGRRADIEYAARASLDHAGKEAKHEVDHGADHQVDGG